MFTFFPKWRRRPPRRPDDDDGGVWGAVLTCGLLALLLGVPVVLIAMDMLGVM